MLVGNKDLFKPDRHVLAYIDRALGTSTMQPKQALDLVVEAAHRLRAEGYNVTPRELDYSVWQYQRNVR